uniref:DOCKER domain-containing protein n=2 Tax=Mesocestoides corti TaxID=53468 RepID=A0A5K3F7F3_MESCO
MIWCPVSDKIKWRKIISKFNDPSQSKAISLCLGDWVYVDQICDGWYYGYKCSASRVRGIFPVACTEKPVDTDLPELHAEIMSLLPFAQQMFMVGDQRALQKAAVYLQEMAGHSDKMWHSFSQTELTKHKCDALEFLSLCERHLCFPLQIRLPNPLSCVSVQLLEKYLKIEKETKERERPTRDLYNVTIELGRFPPSSLTLYLASQSMRFPDPVSTNNGSDQDSHLINVHSNLIDFLRGNDDGSVLNTLSCSVPHFGDFCRISENAFIDGSQPKPKSSVIFSEIRPFSPSEKRILLIITMDRVGSIVTKKGKSVSSVNHLSAGNAEKFRRPLAAACVDITKDLLPILLPFRTPLSRPTECQTKKSLSAPPSSRLVTFKSSTESCHSDVVSRLAAETRSSVLEMLPSANMPKPNEGAAMGSVLPPTYPTSQTNIQSLDTTEALEIEIKDVKTLALQPYHLIRREFPDCVIARPYGIDEGNFCRSETIRNDFFVTLKSASFDKTTVRKEYNVEVEVSLRDPHGQPFPWIESTGDTLYTSSISAFRSQPRWHELIRFALPWSLYPSNEQCPTSRLSRLVGLLDGDTSATEGSTEPFISSTFPKSSEEATFLHRLPMTSHLRFVVRHRSTISEPREKVLGVAYLPLRSPDEQTLIKDGDYSLFIHKMDEKEISECKYLNEKSIAFEGIGSISSSGSVGNKGSGLSKIENNSSHSSMAANIFTSMASGFSNRIGKQPDMLNISTLLCSNQYTNDEHLAKILSWRENVDDVVFCLKRLITYADKEHELKKFRIQLIDCLLQILSTNETEEARMHVQELHRFTVALLTRVYKDLINNAAASDLLERFLESPVFDYSGLHLHYLKVFIELLSASARPRDTSATALTEGGLIDVNKICTTFKWAFRIISKSRELEKKTLAAEDPRMLEETEDRFVQTVDTFFDTVLDVAVTGNDQLLKSHIFKHISETIDPLARVYPQRSLTHYLERLVQCTMQCPNLPNHNILSGCLRSVLMEDADFRKVLLPPIITNLKRLFSTNLDLTLEPSRSETNSMMTYFCNILTLFMERFVETVNASAKDGVGGCTSTHPEFHDHFVQQGLLRWIMQQYGRVLISLQKTSSSTPNSRPASSELMPNTGQVPLSTQSPAKARFLYLQAVLGCLASVFTSILQQLKPADWEALLTPKQQPRLNCVCATCVGLELTDTVDFLHELFFIFLLSHSWPAYPGLHGTNRPFKFHNPPTHLVSPLATEVGGEQPWVEMLALQSTVELRTMEVIFEVCLRRFFMCNDSSSSGKLDAGHQKSRLLINSMQRCLGSFITLQPHLWLEELPTITMVATAPRLLSGCLGDLRVSAGRLLEQLWESIGRVHQASYLEYFIPTVLNMSTEPVTELRKLCVNMLVDMLRVNPLAAEPFLIREVDRIMNWALPEYALEMLSLLETEMPEGAMDSIGRRPSIGLHRGVPVKASSSSTSVTAEKSRNRILGDMIRQINYLREYSEVITRRSKLSGMLAINNLRTYYESIKRKDMTIRYLFKLEELHEQSENDVERGYTLERISGQYNWSSNPVDINEVSARYANLGSVSSSTLKEALLLDALKYLKLGGDWKRAIEVCDQLIVFYRDVTANFTSLSSILSEQSQLYASFIGGEAPNQCCYKYYALHFSTRQGTPGFIGSTVVYRTLNQLNDVKMTLCEQFPEYHIETNNPRPLTTVTTEVTDDVPTIRLVGNLQPVPELPPNWASGSAAENLSTNIKAYYEWNQVRQFTRTYHFKPSKNSDGKELPVAEEVRYTISEKLPNIISFMPVKEIVTRTLSKMELVINLVQDVSQSLSTMIADINSSSCPQALLSNFIGKLSTSIHSPVSGGITALLTSMNLVDDSLDERQLEQLSDAVLQLLDVQAEGLTLCRSLESSMEPRGPITDLLPTMVEQYYSLMHEMSMKLGISVTQMQERIRFANPDHSLPNDRHSSTRAFLRPKKCTEGPTTFTGHLKHSDRVGAFNRTWVSLMTISG